jgi:hypothetical protein
MISSISFFEEIEKFFDRACWNRIAIYTVPGLAPFSSAMLTGAEQAIAEGGNE